jgi:hypothetical protein
MAEATSLNNSTFAPPMVINIVSFHKLNYKDKVVLINHCM